MQIRSTVTGLSLNQNRKPGRGTSITSLISSSLLFLLAFQYSFTNTQIDFSGSVGSVFLLLELLFFLAYMLIRRFDKRTIFLISLFVLISLITYFVTGASSFMMMIITAVVIENYDYKKAFKELFYVRLSMLFVIFFLAIIGALDIYEREVLKSGKTVIIGYGMGYNHPNRLASVFLYLIFLLICLNNDKIKRRDYLLALTIMLVSYSITGTRTIIVATIAIIILTSISSRNKLGKKFKWIFEYISPLIPIICSVLSIVFPLLMLTATGKLQQILYTINGVFSSRFTHIYRAFLNYPVTLFGGTTDFSIMDTVYHYSTVDNGYIRLLYSFGVFGFVIYNFLTYMCIRKLAKKGEYIYISVISVVSVWGITENVLYSLAFNIIPLFWCELLKDNKNNRVQNYACRQ